MKIGDIVFYDYPGIGGGVQAKIKTRHGVISVRARSEQLFIDTNHPFEVWYPGDSEPTGYQVEEDIWHFIRTGEKRIIYENA